MKIVTLNCIFLLISFIFCNAQEGLNNNKFGLVKETFNKLYPGAKVMEWELEENNIFEVEFTYNNNNYEADFTPEGKWIYTGKDIKLNEVPEAILNSYKISEWSSWRIDEVEEISSFQHELLYELKIKQEDRKQFLYYLPDGKLLESTLKAKF